MSAWNDYSSSNEIAAWRVFIDYSLNRDGQTNTPAQMSVFSSGVCAHKRVCVCVHVRVRVCLYVFAAYFLLDSFRHSCNESHWHHPLKGLIAIKQTSTMAERPSLKLRVCVVHDPNNSILCDLTTEKITQELVSTGHF